VIDSADYVVWRKHDGTLAGSTPGELNFAKPLVAARVPSANAAMPEPSTLVLLMFAATGRLYGEAGRIKVS